MISTIIPLNKKYRFVLFLCLMTLAKVNGQNALTGRVINSSNNLPLANVNVFISQTTIGTATDSSGNYRIDKIPNGKFNLVASIIGFEPKVVEVDLKSRKTMVINFSLEPTSYQLKQIEVTEKAPNEWKRQLNFFKKLFFGYNKYAEHCIIENE
ncbi:TPA: carboxypeptidase-like regulatory domain-containing protein, partial [bacterium]|nr:carboxypeptidase-like regulatory domain-containing protein [bacterium]